MLCAPFAWESPCLELIFSMRVPIRKAAEDCSGWERMVGVIVITGRLGNSLMVVQSATKCTRGMEPTMPGNQPTHYL